MLNSRSKDGARFAAWTDLVTVMSMRIERSRRGVLLSVDRGDQVGGAHSPGSIAVISSAQGGWTGNKALSTVRATTLWHGLISESKSCQKNCARLQGPQINGHEPSASDILWAKFKSDLSHLVSCVNSNQRWIQNIRESQSFRKKLERYCLHFLGE